jgi:hypothetical protein
MDCKLVKAVHCKLEEKIIMSFYHLRKNSKKVADSFSMKIENQPHKNRQLPISSLAILSKNLKSVDFVDQFGSCSLSDHEEVHEAQVDEQDGQEQGENQGMDGADPGRRDEQESFSNDSLAYSRENRRSSFVGSLNNSSNNFRQMITKLEKNNPYKNINTAGMIHSSCGEKYLVGHTNNHLKFWTLFKKKSVNKTDINYSLLHEWR